MRDPRHLEVAALAMDLAEVTYQITNVFPRDERFGLVAQMRRAAVSVGTNIAEGCGRTTDRGFVSFLQIALGSVLELEYQAQVASRLKHGDESGIQELLAASDTLKRKLVSLTNAIRRRKPAGAVPMRAPGEPREPGP